MQYSESVGSSCLQNRDRLPLIFQKSLECNHRLNPKYIMEYYSFQISKVVYLDSHVRVRCAPYVEFVAALMKYLIAFLEECKSQR